jgi:hypothetical protein
MCGGAGIRAVGERVLCKVLQSKSRTQNQEFHNLQYLPNIIMVIKSRQ